MSLLGRLRDRLTGRRPYPASAGGGFIDRDRELPWLHEQIRANQSLAPVRVGGPTLLDNFSGETHEMRAGYRRAVLAEPAIKAALLGKVAAVQALDLQVKPYEKSATDQRVADWVKHTLTTGRGGLPKLVEKIILPGATDGFSVGEKVWRRETRGRWAGKVGLQQIKSKDSRYIQFELDPFRNISAVVSYRGNSGERFPPSDFVIFSHLSLFENPFGTSDLRAAYRAAEMIPKLLLLRMIFLDKYSGPFIHGKVRDPALVESMKASLAQARQGGFVATTPEDEIVILDLAAKGTGEFLDALKDLREEVATGISGAFLHMMTGDGGSGQRGNASVQQDTVDLFIWKLKVEVDACINEQLVPDLVDMNFGANVGLPTVKLEAPNPELVLQELEIDRALVDMGFPPEGEDVYERAGRRAPKPGGIAPNRGTASVPGGVPGVPGQPGQPGAVPAIAGGPGASGQPAPGGGLAADTFPAGDWFA